MPTWKSLAGGQNFVHDINGNPNSPQEKKLIFFQTYCNLYILPCPPSQGEFVQGPIPTLSSQRAIL
jgi:hypothetical protein